ncbi:MAG: N-acetylmuramic acid 6-phosphate etherase [Frankiaceae bacterium]
MDVLRRINNEDALVAAAVAEALPAVAAVVELAVASLTVGGRVHYVGAGTSGRIAMLDAVEISQTYGVPKDWFLAHHAGGLPALGELLEDVEDDETAGAMDTADVQRGDVVVGLSASGRSPYVLGALRQARLVGASAVLVSGDPAAEYGSEVDVHVALSTGPEALTGSTRLKAAAAQKMVLNAISTATMIRLGFTYSNLMVGLLPTNAKLRGRALGVLMAAAGEDEPTCAGVLAEAGGDVAPERTRLGCPGRAGRRPGGRPGGAGMRVAVIFTSVGQEVGWTPRLCTPPPTRGLFGGLRARSARRRNRRGRYWVGRLTPNTPGW